MRPGPLVVLGDTLLDIDLDGRTDRLSPDAPVPVVDGVREHARAGGAGLAARFAAACTDRDVVLVTALGADEHADRLRGLCRDRDVGGGDIELVELPLRGDTVRKIRVRAGGQSLLRIDRGDGRAADGPAEAAAEVLRTAGAVLVADYGRGVAAHSRLRQVLTELPAGVPVVWDPHLKGAPPVPGVRLVTPNRDEARAFVRRIEGAPGAAAGAGEPGAAAGAGETVPAAEALTLLRHWRAAGVAVTLGAQGALVSVGERTPFLAPVPETLPSATGRPDTCGAGDCFAAAATAALAAGELPAEAVVTAVREAASHVITGRLTGAARDTAHAAHPAGPQAWQTVHEVRARGGRVVATGGCFDLLHAGHVSLLREARRLGDCLIVCLNSDDSVRALKGPGRPVVPAHDRARVLTALDCVDAVLVFDESTPVRLLERLRPDMWVKGGDYSSAALVEADVVRAGGGEVVLLPCLEGRSTTGLVRRALLGAGEGAR